MKFKWRQTETVSADTRRFHLVPLSGAVQAEPAICKRSKMTKTHTEVPELYFPVKLDATSFDYNWGIAV